MADSAQHYKTEQLDGGVLRLVVSSLAGEKTSEAVEAALDDRFRQGVNRIVVDLSQCDYVDSKGWGTLIWAAEQCREAGGNLMLAAATKDVLDIYQLGGFEEVLPLKLTVAEAAAVLR